jgi:uncharacterized protein with HEPN domain
MLDDKQIGLLKDILDSAKAIRGYLTGVTRDGFMANGEIQSRHHDGYKL